MAELKENDKETAESPELSKDLPTITAEINTYKRIAGEAIFEIGRRLKHVKENDLAHGEFGKWLEEELGIDRRRASEFMRVYDELSKENVRTLGHMGMSALLLITEIPPEQRAQPHTTSKGEEKLPEDMTVKELRELKRQLKVSEQAGESALCLFVLCQSEKVANFYIERCTYFF